MHQGRKSFFLLSLAFHVLLICLLASQVNFKTPNDKVQVAKPIKSYLYKAPVPKKAVEPIQPLIDESVEQEVAKQQTSEPVDKAIESEKVEKQKPAEKAPIEKTLEPEPIIAETKPIVTEPVKSAPQTEKLQSEQAKQVLTSNTSEKTISVSERALRQISNLGKKLDQQFIEQEINEHFRHKSPSVMHGTPIPVPKSIVPLTREQKKLQSTQRLDDNISIVKGDDGTCFIEEDLTRSGIEGVKAVSAFNCGESKFDRSFREHMNKVKKKLGK